MRHWEPPQQRLPGFNIRVPISHERNPIRTFGQSPRTIQFRVDSLLEDDDATSSSADEEQPLLESEHIRLQIPTGALLVGFRDNEVLKYWQGSLLCTNYRVAFAGTILHLDTCRKLSVRSTTRRKQIKPVNVNIPLACVQSVEERSGCCVFQLKDCRFFAFSFEGDNSFMAGFFAAVSSTINSLTINTSICFDIAKSPKNEIVLPGTSFVNLKQELARIYPDSDVAVKHFDLVDWNQTWSLSSQLPREFIFPVRFTSQAKIKNFVKHRAHGRLPLFSWGTQSTKSPLNGAFILRSARFKDQEGLGSDLPLFEVYSFIANSTQNPTRQKKLFEPDPFLFVHIYDTGKQDFSSDIYTSYCDHCFLALQTDELVSFLELGINATREDYQPEREDRLSHFLDTASGIWIPLAHKYLTIAASIISKMATGAPVVIQNGGEEFNTDWVVLSLILVMIDPYYRTIKGFCVLLSKEWVEHCFHFQKHFAIFFHFIHLVWVLTQQHSQEFEFNEKFLTLILESVFSQEYDSLIWKSPQESMAHAKERTCLFLHLSADANKDLFANLLYLPSQDIISGHPGIRLWQTFLLRGNISLSIYEDTLAEQLKEKKQLQDLSLSLKQLNQTYHLENHIQYFTMLTSLDISGQSLTCVPPQLAMLTRLRILALNYNKIGIVPEILPIRLTRLKQLSVRGNTLVSLPASIWKCRYISNLDVSENKLLELPTTFHLLTSLQHLSLKTNRLKRLPLDFLDLTKLQTLDLSRNELNWIPIGFYSTLTRLERLSFAANRLAAIPNEIQRLKLLTKLEVQDNKIQKIPPSFFKKCFQIKELNLSHNRIQELPNLISNFIHLKTLNFSSNLISKIPNELAFCTALNHIIGNSNNIESIPLALTYCQQVQTLHLKENKIRTVPFCLARMWNLRTLDLMGNPLVELPLTLAHLDGRLTPLINIPPKRRTSIATLDRISTDDTMSKRLELLTEEFCSISDLGASPNLSEFGQKIGDLSPLMYRNVAVAGNCPFQKQIVSTIFKKCTNDQQQGQINDHYSLLRGTAPISSEKKKKGGRDILFNLFSIRNSSIFVENSMSLIFIVVSLSSNDYKQEISNWINYFSFQAKDTHPLQFMILGSFSNAANTKMVKDTFDTTMKTIKLQYTSRNIKLLKHKAINEITPNMNSSFKAIDSILDIEDYQLSVSHLLLQRLFVEHNTELSVPVINQFTMLQLASYCGFNSVFSAYQACARLMDAGFIVFKNEMYVLDTPWYFQLLSNIYQSTLISDCGIINHSHFFVLFMHYSEKDHNILQQLMLAFDIFLQLTFSQFEIDDQGNLKNSSQLVLGKPPLISFIASRVLVKISADMLAGFWAPANESKFEFYRLYQFDFLPIAFFYELITVMLKKMDLVCAWRTGVILSSGRGDQKYRLKCEIIGDESKDPREIKIGVRGNAGERTISGLIQATSNFESLVNKFPFGQPQRFVLTPSGTAITQKDLEDVVLSNQSTYTDANDQIFSLPELAPDIHLNEFTGTRLPTLKEFEKKDLVSKSHEWNLYSGLWKKKPVLIKEFTSFTEPHPGIWSKHRTEISHHALFKDSPLFLKPVALCLYPLALVFDNPDGMMSLRTLLDNRDLTIPYRLALHIAKQIASAIAAVHGANPSMLHGDIKPENIWIENYDTLSQKPDGSQITARLTNFGASNVVGTSVCSGRTVPQPNHIAPEILQGHKYGQKIDIFSFGVVCWELVTRMTYCHELPFLAEIEHKIVSDPIDIPDFCPDEFRKIIASCMEKNPLKRPSIGDVLNRVKNIIRSMVKRTRHSGDSFSTKWKEFELQETKLAMSSGNSSHAFIRNKPESHQPVTNSISKIAIDLGVPTAYWSQFEALVAEKSNIHFLKFYCDVLKYKNLSAQNQTTTAIEIAKTYFGFKSHDKPLIQLARDDRKELFKSLKGPNWFTFDHILLIIKSELIEITGFLEDGGIVLETPRNTLSRDSPNQRGTFDGRKDFETGEMKKSPSSPKINTSGKVSSRLILSPRFFTSDNT